MEDPAPARFSITMGRPTARPSGSPNARATLSAAPPGAKPTTSRIGLAGDACAAASSTAREGRGAAGRAKDFIADTLHRRRSGGIESGEDAKCIQWSESSVYLAVSPTMEIT